MQHASSFTRFTALALGIAGVFALGQAQATGFQLRESSVKNVGRASSGTAVAQDDASVVTNNPAAMVNLDRTTVRADVTVIDLTADFEGSATSAFGTPVSGGNGGDPGEPTAVPAMAVVVPLHGAFEGLTVGASVSAPFGLKTEYDAGWVGRYNAIESDVRTVDFTMSAALAINEQLSVGVGAIFQRADVTLSNGIDFGTGLAAMSVPGFAPGSADGAVEIAGDDNSFGWLAGVQYRPTDRLAIGYSYRSEIKHELQGEAEFTVPGSAAGVFSAFGVRSYDDGAIRAPLILPSISTLSLQYDISDSVRVMSDIQRTGWSSLESVTVYRESGALLGAPEPFDWEDSMLYSIGGEYDLSEALTLRAGFAIDETPTNDVTRTPRLPDNDRQLYSVGLTWNVSQNLSVDAAFMRIQIDTPRVDVHSSSSSRLVGEFDGHANLFGVAAQYSF